ncbi:MAG: polyphosphate kinase 2 [Hyphomicrobiaceae bacterium]
MKSDPEAKSAKVPAFDIDAPKLSEEIDDAALGSGGYPYAEKLKRDPYNEELVKLQTELVKLQSHLQETGERLLVLFEGRDSAGKGGCIASILQYLNPRYAHAVALSKPNETERGQWYFQRYLAHLPTRSQIVLFDRSWYNRAGVERVMGFASPEQVANFLREAPELEEMLVRDGLKLFKFYLTIGREMQLKRFHERRHNPLKRWKLTDIDLAALTKWDDYSQAQHEMFRFTHTPTCPWTVIRANDQRRARLEAMRVILSSYDYKDRDKKAIGKPDPRIVGAGPDFFYGT